MCNTSEDS